MLRAFIAAAAAALLASALAHAAAPAGSDDPALLPLPSGRLLYVGNPAGVYDVASQRWRPVDIPYHRGRVATLLPDGDVLLTGGEVELPA